MLERQGEPGYDEYYRFLVRADDEEEARRIAAENSGDEGAFVWMNEASCRELTWDRLILMSNVIMSSFNAG